MNARLKFTTILAGAAVAATSMFGGAASADTGENLIQNGAFNWNTKGWSVETSGSFAKTIATPGATLSNVYKGEAYSRVRATQCVQIPHGAAFELSGRVFIAPGQHRSGKGFIQVAFHRDADCNDSAESAVVLGQQTETGSWTTLYADIGVERPDHESSAVSVQLVADKFARKAWEEAADPFRVEFDDIALVVTSAVDDEDDCLCAPAAEEPVADDGTGGEDPEPADDDKPTLQPTDPKDPEPPVKEPVVLPEPDFPLPAGDEPADSDDHDGQDEPEAPTAGGGSQQPTSGGDGQAPTGGNSNGNGGVTGGAKPQANPTLEPQDPPLPANSDGTPTLVPSKDTTVNVATPTPPPPATGGDNQNDPAGDYSNGEGDSAEVERTSGNDGDGLPMPMLGGGLAGLLALVGLGIVLKRAARS